MCGEPRACTCVRACMYKHVTVCVLVNLYLSAYTWNYTCVPFYGQAFSYMYLMHVHVVTSLCVYALVCKSRICVRMHVRANRRLAL